MIETVPFTKELRVQIPVRAHAWAVGQVPSGGHMRGNHTLMFPSVKEKEKKSQKWVLWIFILYTNVHSSFVCNNSKLKQPKCLLISHWRHKPVYRYHEIGFSNKKEWRIHTNNNFSESQEHSVE